MIENIFFFIWLIWDFGGAINDILDDRDDKDDILDDILDFMDDILDGILDDNVNNVKYFLGLIIG